MEESVPSGGVGLSKPSPWYTFSLSASTFKSKETFQNSFLVLVYIPFFSLVWEMFFLAPSFNLVPFFFFCMALLKAYDTKLESFLGFRVDGMLYSYFLLLISENLGEGIL